MRVRQGGLEKMNAVATAYGALLAEEKPEVVSAERRNQLYIERLEKLTGKEVVGPAEEKLIALFTLLEEYESRHYPVPDTARYHQAFNGGS
jgi:hypothetical protein